MSDSHLTWQLCDKQGAPIASLIDTLDGVVNVGVNDIRNGTVTLSVEDEAVPLISPGDRRLKAFLGESIILNAPVFLPHFEGGAGSAGTVEISAADNFQIANAASAPNINPSTGRPDTITAGPGSILYLLLANAGTPYYLNAHGQAFNPAGVPGIGIQLGSVPSPGDTSRVYFAGQGAWQNVLDLAASDDGVDFELEPLDRDDGVFMRFNTFFRRQGIDKSASVVLEVGTGRNNATGWVWEDTMEQLCNFYVAASATDNGSGEALAYIAQHRASQEQYGLYQAGEFNADFDILSELDPPVGNGTFPNGPNSLGLAAQARQLVSSRAYPLRFFSVAPAIEQGGTAVGWARDPSGEIVVTGEGYGVPPRFAPDGDYWLGDTIGVEIKDGMVSEEFTGRVTAATITQADEAGNVAVALTCTPPDRYSAGVTGDWYEFPVTASSFFQRDIVMPVEEPPAPPGPFDWNITTQSGDDPKSKYKKKHKGGHKH